MNNEMQITTTENENTFPKLLTLEQVAKIFNTSIRFPRRLVDEGRINVYMVGRFVRIAENDVLEYLQANRREAE
jgi:excisionase family DNA binding protein